MGARSLISARWYGVTLRPLRYDPPPPPQVEWMPLLPSLRDMELFAVAERLKAHWAAPGREYPFILTTIDV